MPGGRIPGMANRTDTEAAARRWIEGYLKAWGSNEPADIRALFQQDAKDVLCGHVALFACLKNLQDLQAR